MYQNPNNANNGTQAGGGAGNAGRSADPTQPQQQNTNYNGMQQASPQQQQQQSNVNRNVRRKPYVKIIEQPAGKALRFRYECEGRSAGSIPGVNSTPETKTYPTIEIVGYKGRAVVVVSCVTKDQPYRPHPHNLVGKEGCKKGVCTLEINSETMRAVFSNLGIQCVKKKDIEAALKSREEIRVDPYKTGFSHRFQPSSIDLNAVRLCFQVFMESEKGRFTVPLAPIVSEPIYDKKAMSDLVICRLCSCTASVLGNTQIMLLCEKVAKEDISVRFFEEKNGQVVWEAFGEFNHTDVHKQTAITFKTPRYHTFDITEPAKVSIQLRRPSDGVTSEALPFEYVPLDSGRHMFWNLRRNLKRKPDLDIFQDILAVDGVTKTEAETTTTTTLTLEPTEIIDLNTPTAEQQDKEIFTSACIDNVPVETAAQHVVVEEDLEAAKRRSEHEIDTIIDQKVRELEQQQQQQQQDQQIQLQAIHLPMDQDAAVVLVDETQQQLSTNDKINEWIKSNEIQQQFNQQAPNTETAVDPSNNTINATNHAAHATDEDKTLNDLLDQVAELDEIYTDHILRRDTCNSNTNDILNELNTMDVCMPSADKSVVDDSQTAMDTDDNFDDAATYSSLQKAFKNPIDIPMDDIMPPTPPASNLAPEDEQHYDHVEVLPNALLEQQQQQQQQSMIAHQQLPPKPVPAPHMHVTAVEEEKVPPLPPKRIRKQDGNVENRSIEANFGDNWDRKSVKSQTQIIIMKSPDQSPLNKRLPPKPSSGSCNTLPKQKKPGFFSKLFSRRKSKSDMNQASEQNSLAGSKATSPAMSREPSIRHFQTNDPNRSSIHSLRSLQPTSLPTSPAKHASSIKRGPKVGKPVGRSVSSVSGKRPAHLNADVIHIPLKGDSVSSLPHNEEYSNASTVTLGALDRRTVSALQLADIPLSEGNMELVAIADRQSLKNLCEGEFNVQLDPNVDLTEAEHFALYTSIPPQATMSEFDETSAYYAPVDAGEILTPDEFAQRLAAANRIN